MQNMILIFKYCSITDFNKEWVIFLIVSTFECNYSYRDTQIKLAIRLVWVSSFLFPIN